MVATDLTALEVLGTGIRRNTDSGIAYPVCAAGPVYRLAVERFRPASS